MKKVGLLTLPLKDNYGGILQAVALYSYLTRLGCDVSLIHKENFNPFWKRVIIFLLERIPFQNLKKFRSSRVNARKHRALIDSVVTRRTALVFTRAEIEAVADENRFDAVVVGSDQVWRLNYVDKLYYGNYFLDFVKSGQTKKIAYAASFGLDHWPATEKIPVVARLLGDFDALSVREASGVALCSKFGRSDCKHVLDPTLLVGRVFYEKLIAGLPSNPRKSLLCYVLDRSPFNEDLICLCGSLLGGGHVEERIYPKRGDLQTYDIPQWVKAFADADFVVTDSFHGMVFSIIFNKQFLVVSNAARGAARFESLLCALNISSRLISKDKEFDLASLVAEEIDYEPVNACLDRWRKSSEDFLRNAIFN